MQIKYLDVRDVGRVGHVPDAGVGQDSEMGWGQFHSSTRGSARTVGASRTGGASRKDGASSTWVGARDT